MTVIAALPRSSLHVELLAANDPGVTHVVYRDAQIAEAVEQAFPGCGLSIGREGRLPLRPGAAVRQFAANRRYYAGVREQLAPLKIERLILFLEGEPLERMLADWFAGPIELWEDGLSHYVDLTSDLWYAARGLVQIASGFYSAGALRRRADRSRMLVRDRFQARNLVLPPPPRAAPEARLLVIGSPLVEDGIIRRPQVAASLGAIVAASPLPVRYLPHPRENCSDVVAMLAGIDGCEMAGQPHGLARHVGQHGYRVFVAAVSTAILDLAAFERSLFVPGLFGLGKMQQALAHWPANPVRLLREGDDLSAVLRQLATA